jgi:hypothetical protein
LGASKQEDNERVAHWAQSQGWKWDGCQQLWKRGSGIEAERATHEHIRNAFYALPRPIEGWDSDYYNLPPGASELEDLIEYRNMNFNEGNIFKAIWRKGRKAGVAPEYDLYKIIHFAMRELKRLGKPLPPLHPALHGIQSKENTN